MQGRGDNSTAGWPGWAEMAIQRLLLTWLLLCGAFSRSRTLAEELDFDRQVAPILAAHCLDCHSGLAPKGGLLLSEAAAARRGGDSGPVIVPGNLTTSLLWDRVRTDEMPPGHPLSAAAKQVLGRWIEQGATWGTSPIDAFRFTTARRAGYDWWSLQPLQPGPLPEPLAAPASAGLRELPSAVANGRSRNAIDDFVLRQLQGAGLTPSPEASPRTLIRRLFFDLTGLPPSPEQVAKFVADPSDEAFRDLVEDLLASPHYGERWARHWLDVVRFGESDGFERNAARENAWHYRDWVIRALNEDLPYDDFVRQQLVGDLQQSGPDGAAAVGFWVAGVHNTVVGGSERMKKLAREDELEEVLATVGQSFLGLTVNCARCHDHKFDPVHQAEYYQLAAAVSGLGFGEKTVTAPADAARLAELEAAVASSTAELAAIDRQARAELLQARERGEVATSEPPAAFALWDFEGDLRDSAGQLHLTAAGGVAFENGALVLRGEQFVVTAPLPQEIRQKTLEAWVQLDRPDQRGGGVIGIETTDGTIFDALVFGEQEPGKWMAGSNGFVRTESFEAETETEVMDRPVHLALVYYEDGTIAAYRDGISWGRPIRRAPLQVYAAGQSEIVFGLRHKPAGQGKFLTARIHRAGFHDRALSAEEVAACAGSFRDYVSEKQLTAWLADDQRARRDRLKARLSDLHRQHQESSARAGLRMFTLTPGTPGVTRILLRGDPLNPGDVVAPGGVRSIAGSGADFGLAPDAPEGDRRRRLSRWIVEDCRALLTRVIVNRVWHHHFGTGIVDTPSDFGFNGGRPSHPELLEWLAAWFRDDGYRLKNLHRLIVLSATWRQSATRSVPAESEFRSGGPEPAATDAGNRLLWRMSPVRLDAESLRDAMLAVAGRLNPTMCGPGFVDVSIQFNSGTTYYEPQDVDGDPFFRRTIYRFSPRGGRSTLLDTFDCPDPSSTAPRRSVTTTPLQALSLQNNAFVLRMSEYFAQRVRADVGEDPAAQVQRAWQLALCRPPDGNELLLSEQLVRQHGLAALCRGLFNVTEFVILD